MTQALISIFLIMASGLAFRAIPSMPPAADLRRVIGSVVLNVLLPALTFAALYRVSVTSDLWAVPLVSTGVVVATLIPAWILYAGVLRKRLPAPAVGSMLLAATWCNATYMGLPVLTSVLGPDVRHVPVLFDHLAMTPLLFTIGTVICVTYGTTEHAHSFIDGLRAVIRLPPVFAAACGFAANVSGIWMPEVVLSTCDTLASAVSPLMIFVVGVSLGTPRWRSIPVVLPATLLRLGAGPIVGSVLTSLVVTDPTITRATILESGMPTMMLTILFAERYGLDVDLLAQAILVSTVLSPLTLQLL